MPWKVHTQVEERLRFVTRLAEGERMVDLCREFGVTRKTGYKLKARYEEEGRLGLEDRSRAPQRVHNRTPLEIRRLIVRAKRAHPSWGPKKLRAWLEQKHPGLALPSANTFGYWLEKEGLVAKRTRRRRASTLSAAELTQPKKPNEVWAADFKGQFQLRDGRYCYPLTVTDLFSRYVVAIVALESTRIQSALSEFSVLFREFGVPAVIRSDNGSPFASTGLHGLSALSVYWLRHGIRPERIEPGHPEQNGIHERMHLTLKRETTRPAAANFLQQQQRFDAFREEFNTERPHEALKLRPPASLYVPAKRRISGELTPLDYPLHDLVRTVDRSGKVRVIHKLQTYVSTALAGERLGLREEAPGRWVVSFMDLVLGHVDERNGRLEPRAAGGGVDS